MSVETLDDGRVDAEYVSDTGRALWKRVRSVIGQAGLVDPSCLLHVNPHTNGMTVILEFNEGDGLHYLC